MTTLRKNACIRTEGYVILVCTISKTNRERERERERENEGINQC